MASHDSISTAARLGAISRPKRRSLKNRQTTVTRTEILRTRADTGAPPDLHSVCTQFALSFNRMRKNPILWLLCPQVPQLPQRVPASTHSQAPNRDHAGSRGRCTSAKTFSTLRRLRNAWKRKLEGEHIASSIDTLDLWAGSHLGMEHVQAYSFHPLWGGADPKRLSP